MDAKPLIASFDNLLTKFDGIDPEKIVSVDISPSKNQNCILVSMSYNGGVCAMSTDPIIMVLGLLI